MKFKILLLAPFIVINVISTDALATQCGALFETDSGKKDAGDVLLDMFSLIMNAPNNSKVKVFTDRIHYDGIGALLLMVSVQESTRARGLKFDFNIGEGAGLSRIHDLYAERSTNRVRFRDFMAEPLEKVTTIIIESSEGQTVYQFNGDLTSASLKDSTLKGPIPVRYGGRNTLRASPFHLVDGVTLSRNITDSQAIRSEDSYILNHKSKSDMTEVDMMEMNDRAFDLALQLYVQKKGQSPKEEMDALQILRAVTN